MRQCERSIRRGFGNAAVYVAVVAALVLDSRPAAAQAASSGGKWSIEFYAGAGLAPSGGGGTGITSFPSGTPFTTASSRPSRIVPSWFFGDGTKLFNDVAGQLATLTSSTLRRITPLDSAATVAATKESAGVTFGVRLHRSLGRRLGLELGAERRPTKVELTGAVQDALAATRDSFKVAFEDLLATTSSTNVSVTSTLTIPERTSARNQLTAALTYQLTDGPRASAYVVGGGGIEMNTGDSPEASLNGAYSFRVLGAFPLSETDRVTMTVARKKQAAVAVLGGGATWKLSARASLKADVRLSLSQSVASTTLATSPSITAQAPNSTLPSITTPSIQFSSVTGTQSSLGGTSSLTTFSGSGWTRRVSFTIGIVRRF